MSLESVRAELSQIAPDLTITEHTAPTASVAEAAATIGVEPGQIAKTLAIKTGEQVMLVVARGDARLDNKKLKAAFGGRPSLLGLEDVAALTGHPVGGVCPFGLLTTLPIYCDVSLKTYEVVHPAAGSRNSSISITPQRMLEITGASWCDVCQNTSPIEAQDN